MTIREATRRGETQLVIDIHYRKPDGTQGRYRKDAQVQTMTPRRATPVTCPHSDEGSNGHESGVSRAERAERREVCTARKVRAETAVPVAPGAAG